MNMRHIIFGTLLTLFSTAALATEGDTIDVVFRGTTAEVNIPATANVTFAANGAHINMNSTSLSEEYVYRLSGQTDNGSLTLTGNYKLTLILNGLSIRSEQGAAIDIECGKRIAVVLPNGTNNTLVDCANGVQKAALYFKGHPEFEGGGTLNVTGNTKHAISAKEYLQIKRTTGTINVLGAVSDGIHCGKGVYDQHYFEMQGGLLNISNTGSDCIDSDDFGIMRISGGSINADVTADGSAGLKSDSTLTMTGGRLNIFVSGRDSEGLRTNYDAQLMGGSISIRVAGDGSKAIKSKNKDNSLTVLDGGRMTFGGAECLLYVHAVDFIDTLTNDTTKCRAVSADKDINRTSGNIEIYSYGTLHNAFHSDSTITTTGGTLTIHQAPWQFYYGDFQHDMTAYVALEVNGKRVDSLNDYAIGAFIGDECVGVAIDNYLRIYSHDTDESPVVFRVCNLTTEEELPVTAVSQQVNFVSGSRIGKPNSPLVISCGSKIGDVNRDGQITIADVTALVNIILGKDGTVPYLYDHQAADVNGDDSITIADVTALVNIILGTD